MDLGFWVRPRCLSERYKLGFLELCNKIDDPVAHDSTDYLADPTDRLKPAQAIQMGPSTPTYQIPTYTPVKGTNRAPLHIPYTLAIKMLWLVQDVHPPCDCSYETTCSNKKICTHCINSLKQEPLHNNQMLLANHSQAIAHVGVPKLAGAARDVMRFKACAQKGPS